MKGTTHFGRNAGGPDTGLATLVAARNRLRTTTNESDIVKIYTELIQESLPQRLQHRARLSVTFNQHTNATRRATKTHMMRVVNEFIGELGNSENVAREDRAPAAAPRPAPVVAGPAATAAPTTARRQSLSNITNDEQPGSTARRAGDGWVAGDGGSDDGDGESPPAKRRKTGRLKDACVLEPLRQPRGRPKPDAKRGLEPRLLVAAAFEFLLKQPRRASREAVRCRAKKLFRNIKGRTLSEKVVTWWPLTKRDRAHLTSVVREAKLELMHLATMMPAIIRPLPRGQLLVEYMRASSSIIAAEAKKLRRAERARKAGPSAAARLLEGRTPKALAVMFAARRGVVSHRVSMAKTAKLLSESGTKVSASWVSTACRLLATAELLFFQKLFARRRGGFGLSFDGGSVSEKEAGRRMKLMAAQIWFRVLARDLPPRKLWGYGAGAVDRAAAADRAARRTPAHFTLKRPPGNMSAFFLFSSGAKYRVRSGRGRHKLGARLELVERARKDYARLGSAALAKLQRRLDVVNADRSEATKIYVRKLAEARAECAALYALRRERWNRFPEHPPTPSARDIYLTEAAARPGGVTTVERWRATSEAMETASPAVREACETKARDLVAAQWRVVRPMVPAAFRASGDASVASMGGWDGGARFVVLDVSSRVAAARAAAGWPPFAPRSQEVPPTRLEPLDTESYLDLFKSTVRENRPAPIVQQTARTRLAPPSEARPGALTAARTSTRNPRPVLRFDDEDF